jgi:MoaA/NifB/PqqE/SkfB family radical SAM enzyme
MIYRKALQQPVSAYFELTYRCNWRCHFCYNPRHSDVDGMAAAEWIVVMNDLRLLGTLNLTLTGGEPLAHPEWFDIARAARDRYFAVRLYTNGSLVDDSTADAIASLHLAAVEVSLHGATAETHDGTTAARGSYEALISAVSRLRSRGVRVEIKTPVTKLNEHEIDAMQALANRLDVPFRLDAIITPRDDGDMSPLAYRPSDATQQRLARLAIELGTQPDMARHEGQANCGLGRTTLAIDPEGNVYPCMQWRQSSLGNVRESTLTELWRHSPVRQEALGTAHAANDLLARMGGDAARISYCPAIASQHTGNPLQPDSAFLLRAELTRLARDEMATTESDQ